MRQSRMNAVESIQGEGRDTEQKREHQIRTNDAARAEAISGS
jgi:hypothetical protein